MLYEVITPRMSEVFAYDKCPALTTSAAAPIRPDSPIAVPSSPKDLTIQFAAPKAKPPSTTFGNKFIA